MTAPHAPGPSSSPRTDRVHDALRKIMQTHRPPADEKALQRLLADELGTCDSERDKTFAAALRAPRRPPQDAIDALARRGRRLPAEGRDPCSMRGKLDLLWRDQDEHVAIELKYVAVRKSDIYGYHFLKDLHRLERLTAVDGAPRVAAQRLAVFVTREPVYWHGSRPEPAPFSLQDGAERQPGTWVQYDQQSPDTLWYTYPPFFLANTYRWDWHDLSGGYRALVVDVYPQGVDVCAAT